MRRREEAEKEHTTEGYTWLGCSIGEACRNAGARSRIRYFYAPELWIYL